MPWPDLEQQTTKTLHTVEVDLCQLFMLNIPCVYLLLCISHLMKISNCGLMGMVGNPKSKPRRTNWITDLVWSFNSVTSNLCYFSRPGGQLFCVKAHRHFQCKNLSWLQLLKIGTGCYLYFKWQNCRLIWDHFKNWKFCCSLNKLKNWAFSVHFKCQFLDIPFSYAF